MRLRREREHGDARADARHPLGGVTGLAERDEELGPQQLTDLDGRGGHVGVVATVAQSLKLPNGHIKVMVEGVGRGRIVGFEERPEFLAVSIEATPDAQASGWPEYVRPPAKYLSRTQSASFSPITIAPSGT